MFKFIILKVAYQGLSNLIYSHSNTGDPTVSLINSMLFIELFKGCTKSSIEHI